MTPSRILRLVLAAALVIAVFVFARWSATPSVRDDGAPRDGGRLVASLRQEPNNFNRLMAQDNAARLTAVLTQSTLLRVNPVNGDLEPRLATEWKGTPDGLTWTFTLRDNVKFSDGVPFTAADVVFTFLALYDTRAQSVLGNQLLIGGKPLQAHALDDHHVTVTFPAPYALGAAMLDSVPILPRHKLQSALDQGTFAEAWSAGSNVADIVGLGPFVLKEYRPAQLMRFVRNPNFWLTDASGHRLPYLDEIEVPIITDQNTELLRFQAGESDLLQDAARAEDLAMLRDAEAAGKARLVDAGISADVNTFWFNLKEGGKVLADKPWLADENFRRALSHAINRQAIVDTVYLGEATVVYGPITPGHGDWYVPDMGATPFDLARARTLLNSIGLIDRDRDGVLNDKANRPVQFSLLTQRGHTERERTAEMVSEQLRQVGIVVNVSKLEARSLQTRIGDGDYEAVYYGARASSKDPAENGGFWNSNGRMHFWNPLQATPSSTWEGRIDELMRQQSSTMDRTERRRMFTEMQQQLADHLPALWFAAPHANVPISQRVGGATPSVIAPLVLWNAENLFVSTKGNEPR